MSPGPIDTPGLSGLAQAEEQNLALYAQLASTVPLGRVGQPGETAGIELFVDGGTVQV